MLRRKFFTQRPCQLREKEGESLAIKGGRLQREEKGAGFGCSPGKSAVGGVDLTRDPGERETQSRKSVCRVRKPASGEWGKNERRVT